MYSKIMKILLKKQKRIYMCDTFESEWDVPMRHPKMPFQQVVRSATMLLFYWCDMCWQCTFFPLSLHP
jgi:hypothetical protein